MSGPTAQSKLTMDASAVMRSALRLARRAYGQTSPNPMVGAVLVQQGRMIGEGWHHQAGQPHAEIEAINQACSQGHDPRGAELYVTLEPCSTCGRTPPCTDAIIKNRIRTVYVGTTDPNPLHRGKGLKILRDAHIKVVEGIEAAACERLNEAFNHWIIHRTPWVTVKAAMSLDGKIALASGDSKWITGEKARRYGMFLRQGADAILVGINTVLADDPELTLRVRKSSKSPPTKRLRRVVLDSLARTPLSARVLQQTESSPTTIVVSSKAPKNRVDRLARKGTVWRAPVRHGLIDLRWVLARLGKEEVTSLLVEGGGEVNSSFLLRGLAHRIAFFYAPKILGGRDSRKAVAGAGVGTVANALRLSDVRWRRLGEDLLLEGLVQA